MKTYKIISNLVLFLVALVIVANWTACVVGAAAHLETLFSVCLILAPFSIWGGVKAVELVADYEYKKECEERAAARNMSK